MSLDGKQLVIVSQQDPGHMTGGQGVVLRSMANCAARLLGRPVMHLSMRLRGEERDRSFDGGSIRVHRITVRDSDAITTPYHGDEAAQYERRMEFIEQAVHFIRSRCDPAQHLLHLNGFYAIPSMAGNLKEYRSISFYHLLLSKRLEKTGEGDPFHQRLIELERESLRACKLIQACSPVMKEQFLSLMPQEERGSISAKVVLIPNAVDDIFLETPRINAEIPKRIVAWGRITPEKGFEYLIRAMSHLPDFELVLFWPSR